MIEKIEDIKRIELSQFKFPVNVYLIDDLLIDTGFPRTAKKLLSYLKNKKINKIVNTHGHMDHTGGNSLLQGYFRCRIYHYPAKRSYTVVEKLLFGNLKNFTSETPPEKINTDNYSFEILYTPGHSDDHITLFEKKKRYIFSGDLVLHGEAREVSPEKINTDNYSFEILYTPGHSDDHITLFEKKKRYIFSGDLVLHGEAREVSRDVKIYRAIESLKKLRTLKPEKIFPGHGEIFYGYEVLDEKIGYLEDLGERILRLYEGGKSVKEIVKIVFGGERFPYFFIKGYFSCENLVRSYIKDPKSL